MLSITQAVTRSVRGTFDYKGRSRRSEYWWTSLFFLVVHIAIGYVDNLIMPDMNELDAQNYYGGGWQEWVLSWKYMPLSTGFTYLSLPTLLAVTARRMHDVGRPAWIGVLPLIALELTIFFPLAQMNFRFSPMMVITLGLMLVVVVLGLYSLILCFIDSQRTTNKFGPSPKYFDEADVFD